MAIEIETRKFKDVNIENGILLDCIPTVNIVSGVVAYNPPNNEGDLVIDGGGLAVFNLKGFYNS